MLNHWWEADEWAKGKPMSFPDRRADAQQEVIVVVPEREAGDKAQPPNDRVRVYV